LKGRILTVVKLIFFLGIGLGLVWLVVKDLSAKDKEEIYRSFREANYFWVLVAFLLGVLSCVSRAMRWQMLLEPMGHTPRFSNTFFALMVGYMANYALPRLGEVTRCGILTRYEKVPLNESFGTVVAERAIDLICLVLIFFYTLFSQYDLIFNYTYQRILAPLQHKIEPLVANKIILGLFTIVFLAGLVGAYMLYKKISGKLGDIVKGFVQGLIAVKKVKRPGIFLFHSVFIWLLYFLMNYTGFWAFGETQHLAASTGFSVLVFGSVGMIVVQGGIGAYPLIVMETLKLYGIPLSIGFAYGWIAWSTQVVQIMVVGFISLLLLPVMNKEKIKGDENPS